MSKKSNTPDPIPAVEAQAPAATAAVNIYNARPYPYSEPDCPHRLATAHRAVGGALAIVQLLEQDDLQRAHRENADDPNEEAPPFDAYIRGGLMEALGTCLRAVVTFTEWSIERIERRAP